MTHEDLALIAEVIRRSRSFKSEGERAIFATMMANALRETGHRFDKDRFLDTATLPRED